jgi:hypothetical protein
MANTYGISERDEQRIRIRDKHCVYCGVRLKNSPWCDRPTIEHFNNDGPFDSYANIAMCCRGCNSSKGVKPLLAWLASSYCQEKSITLKTVAPIVRRYLRSLQSARRKSSNQALERTTALRVRQHSGG